MTINAIIAEYNPFHNGHAHQIRQAKQITGADYTIVIMSGDFVQRGAPAIVDKYARARMALECGADLVLELPCTYAVSSAEYFAKGGVNILSRLGVVTHLVYGIENGSLEEMTAIASVLANEPPEYKELLREQLRSGKSFPVARNAALLDYDPGLYNAGTILSSPNNILAVEYLKALIQHGSTIKPVPIIRQGAGYHDRYTGVQEYASATAIRQAITYGENLQSLESVMHASAFDTLMRAVDHKSIMEVDDFSQMLLYKLLMEEPYGYEKYLDVDRELSDRILRSLNKFECITQFTDYLKTKDKTYTRVARALFHILLDISEADYELLDTIDHAPYAKILGFRKESEGLLTEIKAHASIPLIAKYSEAKRLLYDEQLRILEKGMQISDVYNAAVCVKTGTPFLRDFSYPEVL